MKIRPVAAQVFLADGRTDMTKPTVAFRSSANVPQKNYALHVNKEQISSATASCRTALALCETRVVNLAVLLFCLLKCRFVFTRLSTGEKQLAHRRQAAVPRTDGIIS